MASISMTYLQCIAKVIVKDKWCKGILSCSYEVSQTCFRLIITYTKTIDLHKGLPPIAYVITKFYT